MKYFTRTFLMIAALILCGCSTDNNEVKAKNMTKNIYITIAGITQSVTLADNAATQELVKRLHQGPLNVTLDTNGSFEIWGPLGFSLPTCNQQITTQAGDVVLYNGNNICIFCSSNSWSYTRLGHINGLSENDLRTFLKIGQNHISVTLSLSSSTTNLHVVKDEEEKNVYYSLNGQRVYKPSHGIYIKNGKKVIL